MTRIYRLQYDDGATLWCVQPCPDTNSPWELVGREDMPMEVFNHLDGSQGLAGQAWGASQRKPGGEIHLTFKQPFYLH